MQAQGTQAVQVSRRAFWNYMVERLASSSSGEYEYIDMMHDSGSGEEPGESARDAASTTATTTGEEATGVHVGKGSASTTAEDYL